MNSATQNTILAQTYELGQARLRLRTDLKFTLHNDRAASWYLVEDESRSGFYRVGVVEYAFLSLLDGRRTLDEAVAQLASLPCCDDLTEQQSAALARWVVDSGLAETATSIAKERVDKQRQQESLQKTMQWANPIAVRLPLFNPDGLLSRVYGKCRAMFGWPMLMIWLLVCGYGGLTLVMVWDRFWMHQVASISSLDVVWLTASWIVLKALHEGAHGLACKHYGGRVPQFGMLWLLLIPLPYVDVSSSWRFTKKSQRILTAAAGMMAEAFIASIAIQIWANSSPGPWQYHCGNLFIAATVHTLLFNANPLMKFDGYYMLVDAIEIPNLYTRGGAFVKAFFKWAFFGIAIHKSSEPSSTKTRIVRIYGFASLIWMILICITLATAAVSMFSGFGLLIAGAAMVLWLGIPTVKLIRYLMATNETENPSLQRFYLMTGCIGASLVGLGVLVPSPATLRAPVVIQYDEMSVVRARTSGFVRQLHVRGGENVRKGQPLLTLENPQLIADLKQAESELRASRLRAQAYQSDGDIASWRIESETADALEKQWNELQIQANHLQVTAPNDGIAMARDLNQLQGVYLNIGDEMVTVGRPESVHAIALVDQTDAAWLRGDANESNEAAVSNVGLNHAGMTKAALRIWGTDDGFVEGTIVDVSPRATNHLPHFSFASNYGGPLTTVSRGQVESSVPRDGSLMQRKNAQANSQRGEAMRRLSNGATESMANVDALKTVVQYVPVKIKIDADDLSNLSTQLKVGQSGYMLTRQRDESLGKYLWGVVQRWCKSKIGLTHGL